MAAEIVFAALLLLYFELRVRKPIMSNVEELKETNAAVDSAIDRLGDVVRNEARELRERFDAIGNAYAGGLGPEAVSDEIEKGKARLTKLNALADAVDSLSEPATNDEPETENAVPALEPTDEEVTETDEAPAPTQ